MGSLRIGFLVVCNCFHRTGEFEFLLILVALLLFGSTFARMVAAPACEAKRKQGNNDEKKLKFASAMETVAHDEESESE